MKSLESKNYCIDDKQVTDLVCKLFKEKMIQFHIDFSGVEPNYYCSIEKSKEADAILRELYHQIHCEK